MPLSAQEAKVLCSAWFAEFLGTFLLVLVGCGSCSAATSVVQIGLAFGLSVATIVWAIAHISGGHINPAVTVAFLLTRKIQINRAVLYIVAQCGAAAAAAGLLKLLSTESAKNVVCNPSPSPGVSNIQVFGYECLITFVLVFTVFATCDTLRTGFSGSGPLTIGLSVTMCHLWAVPHEGSAMNPARAFGPAVISGYLFDQPGTHAMYWLGPLLGGILAGFLYDLFLATNASTEKRKAFCSRRDYDDSQFDKTGRRKTDMVEDDTDAGRGLQETDQV